MTIITKAGLAAELGISKARVSQYLGRGMPQRSDGRLDREAALNWIASNRLSVPVGDKGVNRAAEIVRRRGAAQEVRPSHATPIAVNEQANPVDAAMLITARAIVERVRPVVARMAVEAGAPMRMAYALSQMICMEVMGIAEEFLESIEHPGFGPSGNAWGIWCPREAQTEPDWRALASKAGEPLDVEAWGAWTAALPWFAGSSHEASKAKGPSL